MFARLTGQPDWIRPGRGASLIAYDRISSHLLIWKPCLVFGICFPRGSAGAFGPQMQLQMSCNKSDYLTSC